MLGGIRGRRRRGRQRMRWLDGITNSMDMDLGPSGEPGVSGDFWGSQEGCQGASGENPHGRRSSRKPLSPARRREERGCGPVTGEDRVSCQSGGAPALRPGAIAQSPGREAALAWASLAQRSPASSLLAREGAGCGSVGDVPGAWLAGGSMVAKLKLKGIDGRAPPGVEPAA